METEKEEPIIIRQGEMSNARLRKIIESGRPYELRFGDDGPAPEDGKPAAGGMTEDEFRERLWAVPDSDWEFVSGVVNDAREFGTMGEIARFIDENPEASSGDVIEFSTLLAGLE